MPKLTIVLYISELHFQMQIFDDLGSIGKMQTVKKNNRFSVTIFLFAKIIDFHLSPLDNLTAKVLSSMGFLINIKNIQYFFTTYFRYPLTMVALIRLHKILPLRWHYLCCFFFYGLWLNSHCLMVSTNCTFRFTMCINPILELRLR